MLTRRGFLKAGLAVAASTALPAIPETSPYCITSMSWDLPVPTYDYDYDYDYGASIAITEHEMQQILGFPMSSANFAAGLRPGLKKVFDAAFDDSPDIGSIYS